MSEVDLQEAAAVIEAAAGVVRKGIESLRAAGPGRGRRAPGPRLRPRPRRGRGRDGPGDARLRRQGRRRGRASPAPSSPTPSPSWPPSCSAARPTWGVEPGALDGARAFVAHLPRPGVPGRRSPTTTGPATSTATSRWCRTRSAASPTRRSRPVAEHIHRAQRRHPRGDHRRARPRWARFGLSVPEEYGGFASGGESEYIGMVVATEELSRGSLGVGGSLITRPEILTRALRRRAAPRSRSTSGCRSWPPAEVMAAVAVTEPDFGSDVAGIKVTATPTDRRRGWLDQRRQDVVHVRRPRRRADAAGPHRPRPLARPTAACRCSSCPSRAATATASSFDAERPARRRQDGGPRRSTRSATAACTPTRSPSTTGSCRPRTSIGGEDGLGPRLLLPDGRLRERPAADRGPRRRRDAGRLRGGPRLRRRPRRCSASPSPTTSSPRPSSAAWRCSSRPPASSPTRSPA